MLMSPLRAILRNSILLLAVALSGCDTERHRLMTDHYPSYPEGMRWAIDRGKILRGMNQDQVYLALGSPVCKKTWRTKAGWSPSGSTRPSAGMPA